MLGAVVVTCGSCGEQNPDRARFCLHCGSVLEVEGAPAGEERKVVTILFCDLVGFTQASDGADPEDVRARIHPYHATLRQEIERHGGTVEKFIGDAVMAVFGAPVAHEDDPERAVRTGLRILGAIADLNEADPTLELQVRVGIETGETLVVVGARTEHGEGMVTGDVVNTASRLQTVAPVDGVVVGPGTYVATRDLFEFAPMEPVVLKGKADPVPLWHAISARSRLGVDLTRAFTTLLVGRDIELGLLRGTFERSIRDSSAQLVTVIGEPGVGKSRLVAELRSSVDDRSGLVRWRQGRCLPYGEGVSFWALGEIVKAEAGILESDPPEVAVTKLDRALPEAWPDREWLRQRLHPLIGVKASSQGEREELFAAWRRFLEGIAETHPAVFVIEDIHWAEESMLAFIEHVAEWSEGLAILLVCTTRPELFDRLPTFAAGARNASRINLAPLSDSETSTLVGSLLGTAVLPAQTQAGILQRAEGNPLYAEEIVKLLTDRGLVVRRGASVSLVGGADIPLPESIQALIAARLDALSPERKALLQDAAVVGKVFWSGAVTAMGDRDDATVLRSLHELSRKELVHTARTSSVAGETEYSFWHALVRDVAYAQIPRRARAEKHRRAAAWIESMSGDRVEDHAEILSHHYTEALALTRAGGLASDAADLERAARRFLVLAGDHAMGLETASALDQYTRALQLAPVGDPERPEILVRWGDAARQAGRHTDAAGALREAIELFEGQGYALGAARAMVLLANVLVYGGDPGGYEVLERAMSRLDGESPGPDLVSACSVGAGLSLRRGAYAESIRWADRAIALAAELGLDEPIRAMGARGTSRCCLGDPAGLDEERRALSAAIERGLGRDAAVLYNNLSIDSYFVAGAVEALHVIEEGIRFAEARGIEEWALWMRTGRLNNRLDVGAWDDIEAEATALAERLEAGGMALGVIWARLAMARLFQRRGEQDRAGPLVEWLVQAVRSGGGADEMPPVFSFAASHHLTVGEPERALEMLRELDRGGLRDNQNYVGNLPELVEVALRAGDPELAERLVEGVQPLYPMHEHALITAKALLAEARGEAEEGGELFSAAAGRWESFGEVWERALALVGHGRCLLAVGRPTAATRSLREARRVLVGLGAGPAVAETDRLIERALAASS